MRMDRMMLVLAPDADQQGALDEFVAAQHDPESPQYQQWLTPESFGERFGVSADDLDAIVNWLEGHGFDVEPVTPERRSIVFSGSAAQVKEAFHTEIHHYRVNGERHYANSSAPEIPRALAAVVSGVASLHNFHSKPMHSLGEAGASIQPEWTSSGGGHYTSPADFATIYNLAPLYGNAVNGTGQSIAIVGRTNIRMSDVETFRSAMGLPANNPTVVLNGADPGIVSSGEQGEAMLDVEWAGAVAKNAAASSGWLAPPRPRTPLFGRRRTAS